MRLVAWEVSRKYSVVGDDTLIPCLVFKHSKSNFDQKYLNNMNSLKIYFIRELIYIQLIFN